MNFLRYDRDTGEIKELGWGDPYYIQLEIDEGRPTLFHDGSVEWHKWRVNIQTKQIEKIPEE